MATLTRKPAPENPQSTGTSKTPLLRARSVTKTFRDGERTLEVLRGIDLVLHRGEAVAVVGSSGAGKSTLLHILGALDRPSQGEVEFDGQAYSRLSDGQLAALRARKVGFIYQFHHLLPEFSALENLVIPGLISRTPHAEIALQARSLLEAVGLGERLHHRPARLSGGEQQRVALARALMNNPDVVLADEPTGDLDPDTGQAVIDVIWKQTVGKGRSFLIVTHDYSIARRANRVLRIAQGRLHPEKLD